MAGRIYVTGDTHGPVKFSAASVDGYTNRLGTRNFPEQKELDRKDYVLIAGDFGGIWDWDLCYIPESVRFIPKTGAAASLPHGESREEKYWLDWLEARPFTTLAIGGNHENYDRICGAYPHVELLGGRAAKIREHVFILENGYTYNLGTDTDPFTVFTFGGARSHDIWNGILDPEQIGAREGTEKEKKELYRAEKRKLDLGSGFYRIRHVSWWPEEVPGEEERKRALANLKAHGGRADLILTHEAPAAVYAELVRENAAGPSCPYKGGRYRYPLEDPDGAGLRDFLERLRTSSDYRYWILGHYHVNREYHLGATEMVLYDRIVRLA